MGRILIATSNPGKLRDFAGAASAQEIEVEPVPNFSSIPTVVEDGSTFEANARKKAEGYSRYVPGEIVVADDSGLGFLGGAGLIGALLLIGVKVVNASPNQQEYPHQLDLGEEWHTLTRLPFVFAMWMMRDNDKARAQRFDFASARDEGLARAEEIVAFYEPLLRLSREELRSYLTENISFSPDEEMRAGMDLYFKLAHKYRLIPDLKPLKTIEA